MKSQKGMSLMEIMIAVSIVGMLAAIGIPSYQKASRKARQVEAKSLLAQLYQSQMKFYNLWGDFCSDLDHLGFYPLGNLKYIVGFGVDVNCVNIPSYTGVASLADSNFINTEAACGNGNFTCIHGAGLTAAVLTGSVVTAPSTAAATDAFTAVAVGNLGGTRNDEWTINRNKNLVNRVNGTD
jgi:prepilin-type N-terminal cleavage/methylation domain-containing protein